MRQLCVLFTCFMTMAAYAQDVIVKRDGSTILSKVLEVNPTNIKYKKFSNPNGPTYTVEKSEIMAVNYENGEKETFNEVPVSQGISTPSTPKTSNAEPDAHNAELIALYNRAHSLGPPSKRERETDQKRVLLYGRGRKFCSVNR